MGRRDELLDRIVDHVLVEGLIGLTLRPLAAAVGTSDRMLIYHFENRDGLVAAVIEASNERGIEALTALEPERSVRDAVQAIWRAYRSEPLDSLLVIYHQAAATGILGREPYRSRTRASNARWARALRDYLVASSAPEAEVDRLVNLLDPALDGCHVNAATMDADELGRAVADLADSAERIARDGAAHAPGAAPT